MQALRIDFILEACANTEQNYMSDTQDFNTYIHIFIIQYIYLNTDKKRTRMREMRDRQGEGQGNFNSSLMLCSKE